MQDEQERRGVRCVCVCSHSLPPCIYRREPRVRSPPSSVNRHWEPMRRRHVAGLRLWGPRAGRPTRVVGRPASGANRPHSSSAGLVWASPCLNNEVELVLSGLASVLGLHLVHLSLNRCSDNFCDFMSGQSVLATCILAQKTHLAFSDYLDKNVCKKCKLS